MIGFFLSCEEYEPAQLLEQAALAEEAGFEALAISDHFHPWNDAQGNSPFVWGMIGALSRVCRLPVMTAVTCPTMRVSPVVTAQAAATSAMLHEGRFRLGVGTGEALNEHIHGDRWPSAEERREMLVEAVDIMRRLWSGEVVNHRGRHYTVDHARLYSVPDEPPEVYVSGFGPRATELAAEIGDGYVTTSPDPKLHDLFASRSGGRPTVALTKVSWAPSEEEAVDLVHRLWATSALPGELGQELRTPEQYEQGASIVSKELAREGTVCGCDVDQHIAGFDAFGDFDEVYVANIGPHYAKMITRYGEDVIPAVRERRLARAS